VADLKEGFGSNIGENHRKVLLLAGCAVYLYRHLRSALFSTQLHERHPSLVKIFSFDWYVGSVGLAAGAVVVVTGVITERVVSGASDAGLPQV
jgi:hypothetical protein